MEAAQAVARRIGMQLIADKKAAVLRAAAANGGEKGISGKDIADRDLLTLLIKANMSTDIPDSQRLSDEDMLARAPNFSGHGTIRTDWRIILIEVPTCAPCSFVHSLDPC